MHLTGSQISKDRLKALRAFSYRLGFQFNNPKLFHNAFIHSSYKNENQDELFDNERLEFLGDSVLNLIVVDFLYRSFCYSSEGYLSYLKSNLISTPYLAKISIKLNLNSILLVSKGIDKNGLSEKSQADILEALLGAIYLDKGYLEVQKFYVPFVKLQINYIEKQKTSTKNSKIQLQEYSQKKWKQIPTYTTQEVVKKDNYQLFTTQVQLPISKYKAIGTGISKKKSEIDAAFNLMDKFKFR